jgi:hypothetical protein
MLHGNLAVFTEKQQLQRCAGPGAHTYVAVPLLKDVYAMLTKDATLREIPSDIRAKAGA